MIIDYAATFAISYLLGSIPFGLLLVRLSGKGDIRKIGSGNIGATNVLRTGSKLLALLTLLLDGGKGALAVGIARIGLAIPENIGDQKTVVVAALGALLGHLFPVWLKFRGGKGVATALGIYLALAWPVGAGACLAWLLTALIFRYSSLAALIAMAVTPPLAWYVAGPQIATAALGIGVIVWLRHRANIARLLNGTEPKIGKRGIIDAPPAI